MGVSESVSLPNRDDHQENTNPPLGLGLQSESPEHVPKPEPESSSPTKSDRDPSPSDLNHMAVLEEEFGILDLGEAEEKSSNKEEESGSDDSEKSKSEVENENGNQMRKKYPYPVRLDAEDCAFYIKTGTCKYGSNCKFNHPTRRKNLAAKEKVKEREELFERLGQSQIECKYYLRTGGCKFGKACRYNHTRAKSPVAPILELNFLGLPIRPGEKECTYYMRNGSCKYGSNCRFNHPDPTAAGSLETPSGYGNGGSVTSVSSQAAGSQASLGSWSSPRALNETAPFVPMIFSPTQVVPSQNPEWNGYQAPLYPPERSVHPAPTYAMKPPVMETNFYTHHQPQMPADEFPERPGQPECSYFLKTGDCKFRSNCKYHHPKNRTSQSLPPPCALSDKGLPLRPDQNICSYYSRYGICKFGPACRFDHPIHQVASSTESGLDLLPAFGNSATMEEAGVAGNESDN